VSERAGRAMDRYVYLHIHTDGRTETCRYVDGNNNRMRSIQGGSSSKKEISRNHSHPKTHQGARHLPEMDRFLGGFSLSVQIEEKSPECCVDG